MPKPAAALATFSVAWAVALPSMLISPVLESPPVPFTVKVSAEVMPVLPTEMPLPLVLLLLRFPPIVRLEPPPPPVVVAVELDRAVAGDAHVAGRADRRAVLQPEIAGDGGEAGQRAVAAGRAGVGDARIRAVEPQPAIDRRDLPALEFQQRVVLAG